MPPGGVLLTQRLPFKRLRRILFTPGASPLIESRRQFHSFRTTCKDNTTQSPIMPPSKVNPGAEAVSFYTPRQNPPPGSPFDASIAPTLFTPLTTRGVTVHNRFVVSPMCTYSADNGHLTDWHLMHLGQFALAGAGTVMVEATAVEARGRISPEDSGLWQDSQIAPLKRIADLIRSQGSKPAIQLAHAGRKASTVAPWVGKGRKKQVAEKDVNGWPDDVVAPSAIPYDEGYPNPRELTKDEIQGLVKAFADSARRAVEAGFEIIEIHGAHGYLHTEFLSPLSNKRTDEYGGSFENRTRFLLDTIKAVRAVIPSTMPLWLRISATEWMEQQATESWDLESSIRLAKLLPPLGIDVLDVSSAGNHPQQRIQMHNAYQTDLAGHIRKAIKDEGLELVIAAVGQITQAEMARELVQEGKVQKGDGTVEVEGENGTVAKAELVLAARQFLRDPQWVLTVARELNVDVKWANQYERAKPKPTTRL